MTRRTTHHRFPNSIALIALFVLTLCIAGGTMAQDSKNFVLGGINLVALTDFPAAAAPANPPTQILVGLSDAEKAKVTGEQMRNAVNMFVLKTPSGNILFDTGVGSGSGGGMLGSLKKAGMSPADIAAVVITHFHGDHIGGLTSNGKAVFTNATLYVPKEEMEKGPPSDSFAAAYAGRTKQFVWGDEIFPGVLTMDTSGHTNGHTSYMITDSADGKNKLFIAGDLIHFGGVQLPNPDIAVTYDTDTTKAPVTRRAVFDMLSDKGIPMASMHLPFPAVGRLSKSGAGYDFAPLP